MLPTLFTHIVAGKVSGCCRRGFENKSRMHTGCIGELTVDIGQRRHLERTIA